MNHTTLPPVTTLRGDKYFQIGQRTARAVKLNGRRVYADDYPVSVDSTPDDAPREPGDYEFARLMGWAG